MPAHFIYLLLQKTSAMFSVGQLIFALFFVVVFTAVIIRSYRKDKAEQYFKGSSRVLVAIAVVVILLFSIKLLTVK